MNDQCSRNVMSEKSEREDVKKYPWFTVLIGDGTKDSQGHIIYLNKGTKAIIPEKVLALAANRNDSVFGSLVVVQCGDRLQAKFVDCSPLIEPLLNDLTPSISGEVIKENGAFLEVIRITNISFDYAKNSDKRVLSIREQRKIQEDQDMSNVKGVD